MPLSSIRGIFRNGKIDVLETVPYIEEKKVIITFIDDIEYSYDKVWDEAVARDFVKGYSEKDSEYDLFLTYDNFCFCHIKGEHIGCPYNPKSEKRSEQEEGGGNG